VIAPACPSRGAGVARPFELSRREKFLYSLHDPLALNLVCSFADLKSPRAHRTAENDRFPANSDLRIVRTSIKPFISRKNCGQHGGLFLGGEA